MGDRRSVIEVKQHWAQNSSLYRAVPSFTQISPLYMAVPNFFSNFPFVQGCSKLSNFPCVQGCSKLFTCGEARRSMDHNSSPSHFIWLLEAFRSRRDTGTYIFEAREFDSEAICILRGRPEAVDKAVASY